MEYNNMFAGLKCTCLFEMLQVSTIPSVTARLGRVPSACANSFLLLS
jgi:hypothetical protein